MAAAQSNGQTSFDWRLSWPMVIRHHFSYLVLRTELISKSLTCHISKGICFVVSIVPTDHHDWKGWPDWTGAGIDQWVPAELC